MSTRRVWLWAAAAAFAALLAPDLADAGAPPKKKLRKELDRDRTNDVVGAVWKVTATNAATGETINFRFRAKDGVLYNRDGEKVGAIKSLKQGESLMTWNAPLPLEGQIKIVMAKVGRWNGVFKTQDGQEWKCRLEAADR